MSRALRILTLLERADGAPLPLGDIARGIEAAKSSTFNLCQALEEGGMIVRANGGYLLGRRTVELGGAYIAQFNQMREFYAFCDEAELLRHEVVQIAMLARDRGRLPRPARGPGTDAADGQHRQPLPGRTHRRRERAADHAHRRRDRRPVLRPAALPAAHRAQRADACPRCWPRSAPRGSAATPSTTTRSHPGIFGVALVLPPWSSGDQPLAIGTSLMAATATEDFVAAVVDGAEAGGRPAEQPARTGAPSSEI